MRKIRVFFPLEGNEKRITISEREKNHLTVLRVGEGDSVSIISGSGFTAEGLYQGKKSIAIESIEKSKLKPQVDIYIQMLKKKAHRTVIRNITSFPVRSITLFGCENSILNRSWKESDKIILRESIKQSGNPFMPVLKRVVSLDKLKWNKKFIFGSLELSESTDELRKVTEMIIGPEGGFTKREEEELLKKGGIPVRFSPHVLRAEISVFSLLSLISFNNMLK